MIKKCDVYTFGYLLCFLLISTIIVVAFENPFNTYNEIQSLPQEQPIGIPQPDPTGTTPPLAGDASGPMLGPLSEEAIITTASGKTLSNLGGSMRLLIMFGELVGGLVVSSADNNAVPTFNPLTGDFIVYNMGQGDSVAIEYTGEPGYSATLSSGVQAEIDADNRIRFTAYGDDSQFKIKSNEEDPGFDFSNGLLEYENDDIIERISSNFSNLANVDKEYSNGFKCLSLGYNDLFEHEDKLDNEKSFSIKNLNHQSYKVCIRKSIYDKIELPSNRYAFIDLVKDRAVLKGKVIYLINSMPIYESFDLRNHALLESSLGITKLLISNPAPSSEIISKTFIGKHMITEKNLNGEFKRQHFFAKKEYPKIIGIYSTEFSDHIPDIKFENDVFVQAGVNRFSAFTDSKQCTMAIGSLFDYAEDDFFYDNC